MPFLRSLISPHCGYIQPSGYSFLSSGTTYRAVEPGFQGWEGRGDGDSSYSTNVFTGAVDNGAADSGFQGWEGRGGYSWPRTSINPRSVNQFTGGVLNQETVYQGAGMEEQGTWTSLLFEN